jgi:hypothetical protein
MMKDAYSNLLGEYVEARDVDNHDVAGFQIVCPCCRDAIYKVTRETDQKTLNFFSHYRAPKDFSIAECERRVGSIGTEAMQSASNAARAKSLDMFRKVVRDAVRIVPISGRLISEIDVERHLGLYQQIAAYMALTVENAHEQGKLYSYVADRDQAIDEFGHENLSSFGAAFRNRTAVDIVRTLFAGNHTKSVLYMVARGFNTAYEPHQDGRWTNFGAIGRGAKLLEASLPGSDFGSWDIETGQGLIMANLSLDAIIRELQRLPFQKMIENSKAGRPPLANITIDDYLPDLEDMHRLEYQGTKVPWPGRR